MMLCRSVVITALVLVPIQESLSQSLQSKIDELVNEYVAHRNFMGSVLVADKGKVVFSKGYGLADVEKKIPNTPETRGIVATE